MSITLHKGDLPKDLNFEGSVAVDTETLGLNPARDRLCVVQLSAGDGTAHLIKFDADAGYDAPNLKALLTDSNVTKIFHYARFDIAAIKTYLEIDCSPVYCTKIASRLSRTYTDKHSLSALTRELLGIELDKGQQSSDWGADSLSEEQQKYAANDVLYLHQLRKKLDDMLTREKRTELAQALFECLPARAWADLEGWADIDIFAHN